MVIIELQDIYNKIIELFEDMKLLGYEYRDGQETLIYHILDAFDKNQNLIVEASVGIGKSLAYLLPGILISKMTKKPLIVSSSTIQLTEQLEEDVLLAKKLLDCEVEFVIGKGTKNYACEYKVSNNTDISFEKKTLLLEEIKKGATKQKPLKIPLSDWKTVEIGECKFDKCNYRHDCIFYNMRQSINKNNIERLNSSYIPKVIIVNHDLLLAHYKKTENSINGLIYNDPCMIVIDEVHNLEEKQRTAVTDNIRLDRVEDDLRELLNVTKKYLDNNNKITYKQQIDELGSCIKVEKTKILSSIEEGVTEARTKINDTLYSLEIHSVIKELIDVYDIFSTNTFNNRFRTITETRLNRIRLFEKYLFIEKKKRKGFIVWAEVNKNKVNLSFCPDNQSEYLQESLFSRSVKCPVICVSATIRVPEAENGGYDYIINSIGFDIDENIGDYEHALENDFNYNLSRLYIPPQLPDYNTKNESYYHNIANHIATVTCNNKGGTLALFTSKKDIQIIYDLLIKNYDLPQKIFIDTDQMSQRDIIEQFKKEKGLILGTGVFWEGIDLKKEYLTSLIIVQLPFPVPDPIIENKIERIGDSDKVVLPEMLIKLKQGVGRLIRSQSDIGLLTILDNVNGGYKM